MSETDVQNHEATLPPEMYRGGFRDSAQVIDGAVSKFGLTPPLTIYYPGSSSDVSLLDVSDAHVIHADSSLDKAMLDGFEALGAEAHNVDVHDWGPSEPVDLVTFVNPSGIDEGEVLAHTRLRPGGVVLWYSWSGRPHELQNSQDLELVGAVLIGDEEGFDIDTDAMRLPDYFIRKSFDELEEATRQTVTAKIDAYMHQRGYKFGQGNSYATAYSSMQDPANANLAFEIGINEFPYKEDASCFIYQKRQEDA